MSLQTTLATPMVAAMGALALMLLAAACSGGDRRDPLTLEQYFPRVEALFDEQESRSEAMTERLSSQFDGAAADAEAAVEAALAVLPAMMAELRPILDDLIRGLEAIDPPAEVVSPHAVLVEGYREVRAMLDDLAGQLDRGEGGVEVFAAFTADASTTDLGRRLAATVAELEAVAQEHGIAVDLSYAGGQSGGGSGEGVIVEGRVAQPDAPTGIAEVDAVIAAVIDFDGDFAPIESRLRYAATECTLELGAGGPPKCWQVPGVAQVEGTAVEVFPTSVCEAEYHPRGANITRMLSELVAPQGVPGSVTGVHAVYALRGATTSEAYWPEGDYAIVFFTREGNDTRGVRVRVAGGEIVRIDFGCGPTPVEQLAVPGTTNLLLRTLPSVAP